jgi:hypothetical protein
MLCRSSFKLMDDDKEEVELGTNVNGKVERWSLTEKQVSSCLRAPATGTADGRIDVVMRTLASVTSSSLSHFGTVSLHSQASPCISTCSSLPPGSYCLAFKLSITHLVSVVTRCIITSRIIACYPRRK